MRRHVYEAAYRVPGWVRDDEVTCDLDAHPHGDHHGCVGELTRTTALWARWPGGAEAATLVDLPYCTSRSPGGDPDACFLHAGHRGGHSWERFR
ncbi:hypothetical protein [Streptomyces pactum]|uniref:hypothetical protein n=1 Tax=Streptomyces pactum TaxID=68249 RepID=UPI0036FDBF5F